MKANPTCRKCSIDLNDENWYTSQKKINNRICKACAKEVTRLWQKANPEKAKDLQTRARRKRGVRPFSKNKKCSQFLGVHIAEQVLSQAFKNVKRMPYGHPGFDVICNRDKLIDIKSSCLVVSVAGGHEYYRWQFTIRRNPIADFFLLLAFDNREDLNPLYAWLIPGSKLNHLVHTSISLDTIHKWDAYRLDITKIVDCCDAMK